MVDKKYCTERITSGLYAALFRWTFRIGLTFSFAPAAYSQSSDVLEVSALKQLSIEELTNMEVTSVSKRPEKLTEAASAIQVITQADIQRSGATTVTEALRLLPNLQVAQVNSSQWAVSARGFNNVLANKLLVLIDGRVVYTPMYAGVFWDVQNLLLENIDRIEVISGPGGTLWGANAVNGVINIITKNSKDTQGIYAEAAVGTELRGLASLRYGGKINDKLSFRISGTAFKRDDTIYEDSINAGDAWGIGHGSVRADWDNHDNDNVAFIANVYNGRPDPDGGKPVIARGGNALMRWKRDLSAGSGFQLQAFYDHTWRDFRNDFTEALHTYDIEGQHRLEPGKSNKIIYGGGFRFMDHNVTNLASFGFEPERKSLYLYNVFVQDELTVIPDRFNFTLGIKIEHSTYAKFQYQPNARLTFIVNKKQTIWTALSRAIRAPARLDREFFVKSGELDLIKGSDFKSEEVVAYELGWRIQPKEVLSLSASTFYNWYDNIRSVEPGPAPTGYPFTLSNGVKGNTYGAELTLTAQPFDWWRIRGGYTLLRKDLHVKPNNVDINNASAESNDPKYQLLMQSSIDLVNGFGTGVVFRYIGELQKPEVAGYAGLDVRLSWRYKTLLEFSVVGQNLIKDAHTEFIPSSGQARAIERGVYGKIACRL
jgi:iron complex outermembrane recepter protein